MTGPDPSSTTVLLSDKLSLVTHHYLLTRVPVKLDLENWNYGSWEYFFDQLCYSYEVSKYIHGSTDESSSNPTPLTPEELKVDKIVLSWIFTTLSDPLQARLVVGRPKSAKEAWDLISNIVKDNKRSRTNALKAKLRSIKLGDQSMESYFRKIESTVTILASLDSHVNDEYIVHYALEGLPEQYNQVCGYMHYKDTFPDLKTARSLVITEEMSLKSKSLALLVDSSFASPMILMAETGMPRPPYTPQVKSWRPCYNFAKGACRFGNNCKFVYDSNAKSGDTSSSKVTGNNTDELLVMLLSKLGIHDGLNHIGRNKTNSTSTVTTPLAPGPTTPSAFHTVGPIHATMYVRYE
ncbi:ribonuclease H-like domain-containing protein [Tanacetum coccineum]